MLYEILLDAISKGIEITFKREGDKLRVTCYHPKQCLRDDHELKPGEYMFEESVVSRRIIYSVNHMS